MGLAGMLSQSIQNQRVEETNSTGGYRWMVLFTNMIGYMPQIFAPVLTFVTFEVRSRIQGSSRLSSNQAITSLTVITLLTTPASIPLTTILEAAAAIGCFERIQKFLVVPSWEDPRSGSRKLGPCSEPPPTRAGTSTRLKQLHVVEKDPIPRVSRVADQPTIVATSLTARPLPTAEPAITNINLQLKASTTTIITDPVGSGKSTLLRAILGELSFDSGDIYVSSMNMTYLVKHHGFSTPLFNKIFVASELV